METRSPFVGPWMLEDACELAKAATHNQSEASSDGLVVDWSAAKQPGCCGAALR